MSSVQRELHTFSLPLKNNPVTYSLRAASLLTRYQSCLITLLSLSLSVIEIILDPTSTWFAQRRRTTISNLLSNSLSAAVWEIIIENHNNNSTFFSHRILRYKSLGENILRAWWIVELPHMRILRNAASCCRLRLFYECPALLAADREKKSSSGWMALGKTSLTESTRGLKIMKLKFFKLHSRVESS